MKVKIVRQHRKSLSVTVDKSLSTLIVKAPSSVSDEEVMKFLSSRSSRIERMIAFKRKVGAVKSSYSSSTPEGRMKRKDALAFFIDRTRFWSEKTGLYPKNVGISLAETRFGSCNRSGKVLFSVMLMEYDLDLIDAVIVHELCHLLYMNHGKDFYALLEEIMPDYPSRIRKLRRMI